MNTISDRLRAVIEFETEEARRAPTLASLSGIALDSWKKFLTGKQRASLEMLQWACETWPHHAFYISTGITDSRHGHVGPPSAYAKGTVNRKRLPRRFSLPYFKWKISQARGERAEIDWDELLNNDFVAGSRSRTRIDENYRDWEYSAAQDEWQKADDAERERIDLERLMRADETVCDARDFYLRYSDPNEEEQLRKRILSGEFDPASKT